MQAQPQGVCAAPPLTRNPSRVWKAHVMEIMEAAAAMVGEVRGGLRWRWPPRERRRRSRPPTAAVAFGVKKWRFHGRFAAARGGAQDMVVLGALVVAFETWVGCLVQFVIVCVV